MSGPSEANARKAMTAIIPPRVARGQTVGIVAPAGPVKLERLRRGLAVLGDAFELRVAPSVTGPRAPSTPSYLAASDEVRAVELMAMLEDPDVRAVILARGGYGIMRILSQLDPEVLRRDPKPIVGFSDATALLVWAHTAGVRGIHGPVITTLADLPPDDLAQLIALLTSSEPPGVRPWPLRAHGRGCHRGPLVPANLSLAAALIGTPWPVPFAGAIAVLEEVGEKPYRIDRYLTQLALAGALGSTAAVVVGDLTRCTDPRPPTGEPDPADAALTVILDHLRAAGTPAAVGAPLGHENHNEAVPFGAACELDLDRGAMAITEAAVS